MVSREIINAYIELTKPRILSLVLVTTAIGFFMGQGEFSHLSILFWTILGAGLVCAGASALNQYLERDADSKMERTKLRPLPMGTIRPSSAMLFGVYLILIGVILLCLKVNLLSAFLALLTAFLYILVYTPLKRLTWLNTTIGAIPGAIPPMGGWAAATGQLDFGAWVLFFIMFTWQHPHFYAIAWMLKEDYKKAGFKMLPVVYPDGKSTFLQIFVFTILLFFASLVPAFIGMSGKIYLAGAVVCGIFLFMASMALIKTKTMLDARQLLKATVFYLPILLFLIVIDCLI